MYRPKSPLSRYGRSSCWRRSRAAFALLLAACAPTIAEPTPEGGAVYHYHSATHGLMESTIKVTDSGQHISAITRLADGSCVTEEVQLDADGRVLEGQATLSAAGRGRSRKVVFDAAMGTVDVTGPSFQTRWKVPHDLPWAWTSLLNEPSSATPISTPLDAIVALRAASTAHAIRWLNTDAFETHTIMVDQILVPEDGSVTAVLGDDWADLVDGMPAQLQLAALQTRLLSDDTRSPLAAHAPRPALARMR